MVLTGVVISIVIASFLMSFSIGANDAANALSTSYGSNAIKIQYLLVLGAIFEFIGASLFSSQVAGTLADQFIIGLIDVRVKDQITMMVGTSFSSVLFIMSSSIFGLPISGTHTIVGAFIGAGIAALGQQSINWKKLGTVVLSWFISPLFSGLVSFMLFILVCLLTL